MRSRRIEKRPTINTSFSSGTSIRFCVDQVSSALSAFRPSEMDNHSRRLMAGYNSRIPRYASPSCFGFVYPRNFCMTRVGSHLPCACIGARVRRSCDPFSRTYTGPGGPLWFLTTRQFITRTFPWPLSQKLLSILRWNRMLRLVLF